LSVALDRRNTFLNYIEVLKPRETSLLLFIGACSAIIASGGYLHLPVEVFVLAVITIALGSAGCNGLTNYLDREVDARAKRTWNRVLPSKRIYPPQKVLPLIIGLIVVALALAYILNPLCFLFGLIGTIASAIWRKTVSCTLFGIIAGCSPVLIGWFALRPEFDVKIMLICLLVASWIPIHIWSVMVANREDYLSAGLNYFPLSLKVKDIVKILFGLSLFLYAVSIFLYILTDFNLLYLVVAIVLGTLMVCASARLLFFTTSLAAWQVYKLSSFPYLGIIFLVMCLDTLLI
jgi:protoheme IX farnesyltransferase